MLSALSVARASCSVAGSREMNRLDFALEKDNGMPAKSIVFEEVHQGKIHRVLQLSAP